MKSMSHSEFVQLLKCQHNLDVKITRRKVYISQTSKCPFKDMVNKLDFSHRISAELSHFNGTLLEAIQNNKLVPAVKEIRNQLTCSLYDAKAIFDYLYERRYSLAI